jgi:hypothetical protein
MSAILTDIVWIVAAWAIIIALSFNRLTHICYFHVKDLIKGDQAAAYRAMRRQHHWRQRHPNRSRGEGLHQPTVIKVADPVRHVVLHPAGLFFLLPIRRNLRGVRVHWTPLVGYPDDGWLEDLTEAVAHFLGEDPGQLDRRGFNVRRKRVTFLRSDAVVIPQGLPYDEFPTELPQRAGEYRDVG